MSIDNPQLEDGYLKIVLSIAETLARTQLSGYESRVLWLLWRKTYGWSKKSDRIPLCQFVDGTGINKRHVINTLSRLVKRGIIYKDGTEIRTRKSATYEFNKHFKEWKEVPKSVPILHLVPKSVLKVVPKSAPSIDIVPTDKGLKDKDCAEKEKTGAPLFENFLEVFEETETKPNKAIQVTTSVPYSLASWLFTSRGIPAAPTEIDMHNFKLLLKHYSEDVIKQGIEWRLANDPNGQWALHISSASVYRNFGNWMAESSVKTISLKQWIESNPTFGWEQFTDEYAKADAFQRAFKEAKRNPRVRFTDDDFSMLRKATRIKTRKAQDDMMEAKR